MLQSWGMYFLGRTAILVFKAFTGWIPPTPIMMGNLFYYKRTDLTVHCIHKSPPWQYAVFHQTTEYHSLSHVNTWNLPSHHPLKGGEPVSWNCDATHRAQQWGWLVAPIRVLAIISWPLWMQCSLHVHANLGWAEGLPELWQAACLIPYWTRAGHLGLVLN
jgi:hypothetical protein